MARISSSSMHPHLHFRVQSLLDDEQLDFTFRPRDEKSSHIKYKNTSVTGMFQYGNSNCAKKWSSKCIAIVIRMFRDNKYTVVVYHQRCERCDTLAQPTLDETYEERVARWLKIWSGIDVPRVHYERKRTPPHQRSRCEGCKAGHCTRADD